MYNQTEASAEIGRNVQNPASDF